MSFDPYGSLDPGNGPVSIRWPIFTTLCLYIIFAILGGFFFFVSFNDQRPFLKIVALITGLGALFVVSLSLPNLLRVWWRGSPGLELRVDGFVAYPLSPALIRWKEIASWSVVTAGAYTNKVKLLNIELRPGVMDRLEMPRWKRWQLRGSTFYIGQNMFECSFDELVKVFERYAPRAFSQLG